MCSVGGTSMAKHVILMYMVLALNFTQLAGLPFFSSYYESGRVLAESNNVTELSRYLNDSTVRVDPLDHFKKYRGGYDIQNKHYWSSIAFTGRYGYIIAVIWLLCGLGYGLYLLLRFICCKNRKKHKHGLLCHKKCYLLPFILVIVFTFLAVTACGLALGGDLKFHTRIRTIINIVIDTTTEASETIYKITGAMTNISNSLSEVGVTNEASNFLNSTSQKFNNQAADIHTQASQHKHLIDKVLKISYTITTMTISLTLILVVSILALGILKFHRTLQVLLAVAWIFTIFCWLFFGVYFFLQNFAGDTCMALEGFQQNPYNNSLSSILPCDELLSAKSILTNVTIKIHELVQKVNQNISMSYGNILQICNPFSPPPAYEYQPWNCPPKSVRIGEIPTVLRQLACPDSEGDTCNGGLLVPASYYKSVKAYSISTQKFLDTYPSMQSLIECQIIKDALSQILDYHCKPFKKYTKLVWSALVFLSVVLMALILIWTVSAHHEQKHHCQSSDGSAKSHSVDTLEFGTPMDPDSFI